MTSLPLTPTKALQGHGVYVIRGMGNTRSNLTRMRNGKVHPAGPLRYTTCPTFRKSVLINECQAVCVSACGNFCLAATSTGLVNMWNMQSGLKRKKFDVGPCPPGVSSRFNVRATSKKQREYRSVTDLATDALNRLVIASTLDGTINVGELL